MPAPSQIAIATSAVNRLVKEEASYHKEIEQQKVRIAKLEQGGGDENAEYELKQEKRALDESYAVFPSLHKRIEDALAKLEQQLAQPSDQSTTEETTKAKEAVAGAKTVIKESA